MPGLGLSGLFVLLSALALPLTRRRGVPVGRLFGLAAVMAAAIILTWEVITVVVTATASGTTAGAAHPLGNGVPIAIPGASSVRVPILVISASIMVLLIATGAALLRLIGVRPTPSPPPIRSALPPKALAAGHAPPLRSPRHARPGERKPRSPAAEQPEPVFADRVPQGGVGHAHALALGQAQYPHLAGVQVELNRPGGLGHVSQRVHHRQGGRHHAEPQ